SEYVEFIFRMREATKGTPDEIVFLLYHHSEAFERAEHETAALMLDEKSWLHFRPSAVDFCCSRLAIGAATERARALAMPAERAPKAYKRDSSGVAPASPQVAYRALLERCIGRPPKKVGRIFGRRRGLGLPAWPRLGHNFANDL